PKKSGGLLTMLFIVVAFGAAGAGAYMYLNKEDGMTSIMGGFSSDTPANDTPMVIDFTAPQPSEPMMADAPIAQPSETMPAEPGAESANLDTLTLSMP